MTDPNQTPQPEPIDRAISRDALPGLLASAGVELPQSPVPGEFDHLFSTDSDMAGAAVDPQRPAESAAVRPETPRTSSATAEAERMQKLGDLNSAYGPIAGPKTKSYEQ